MDKYIENRFSYLKEYTIDELLKEKEELISDTNHMLDVIYSEGSSLRESEFQNVDLKYNKEKLEYIEFLLKNMSVRHKSR